MCHILSTLTTSFPFLFLCLAIAILFHLHLVSHIISNTFYISYSPLISLPWSTAGCYALCSLCSPPSLGESLEFSLWIPLARIWVLCSIVRLPLQFLGSGVTANGACQVDMTSCKGNRGMDNACVDGAGAVENGVWLGIWFPELASSWWPPSSPSLPRRDQSAIMSCVLNGSCWLDKFILKKILKQKEWVYKIK